MSMENPLLAACILELIMDGVMITDAACAVQYVNPAFTAITGYSLDEVKGKNPRLLSSGRQDQAFYQKMWASIHGTGQWQGEIWNRRKNGEIYPEWENIVAIKDEQDRVIHYVAIFSDITALKHTESRFQQLAYHDALTGLANRLLFQDRLRQTLAQAERNTRQIAVLFIDLDDFKNVNDTLGHGAGDTLIQLVAERLARCVRKADTIARLGGDEFVALLASVTQRRDAINVAQKILHTLSKPFNLQGRAVHISASIGISVYPHDGADAETLMTNADAAMYKAKQQGKNKYQTCSHTEAHPMDATWT